MASADDYANTNPMARKVVMPTGATHPGSDPIDGALIGIDVLHHHVHEGEAFISWAIFNGVLDDAVEDIFIVTGELEAHVRQIDMWVNNAHAVYNIHEGAQGTGTTVLNSYNRNRIQAALDNQATMRLWTGITNPNIGSKIIEHGVAGGGGANMASRTGGVRSQELELILRPNTNYAIRIQNLSGATADIDFAILWYEEETPS